jgi:A/G-specific adenine glycosylase
MIRPLGLVRRAAILKTLAGAVEERGSVPDSLDELEDLPGVGRYAASATLAVAFEQRAPVVDGVSARVYRRYFGLEATAPPASDGQLWELVSQTTPGQRVRDWNWAVLDLAASVCLPKVPRCEQCPLRSRCAWSLKVG